MKLAIDCSSPVVVELDTIGQSVEVRAALAEQPGLLIVRRGRQREVEAFSEAGELDTKPFEKKLVAKLVKALCDCSLVRQVHAEVSLGDGQDLIVDVKAEGLLCALRSGLGLDEREAASLAEEIGVAADRPLTGFLKGNLWPALKRNTAGR